MSEAGGFIPLLRIIQILREDCELISNLSNIIQKWYAAQDHFRVKKHAYMN